MASHAMETNVFFSIMIRLLYFCLPTVVTHDFMYSILGAGLFFVSFLYFPRRLIFEKNGLKVVGGLLEFYRDMDDLLGLSVRKIGGKFLVRLFWRSGSYTLLLNSIEPTIVKEINRIVEKNQIREVSR